MAQYIFSKHNHFDADTLIDEMKSAGLAVSRATVWSRTLTEVLVDAGLLRQLDFGPRMYYEHDYGYPAHDHMFCTNCHRVYEFQHPAMSTVMDEGCYRTRTSDPTRTRSSSAASARSATGPRR